MATPDMDVIKEIPGYKVILKAILKSQIQQLVEQLASHTEEETVILTASVSDGTLSHLGSDSGKFFLEDHDDIKSQFLGFCLKRHHRKKLEEEQKKKQALNTFSPPSFSGTQRSPYQRSSTGFGSPQNYRHHPYSTTQPKKVPLNYEQMGTEPINDSLPSSNSTVIKVEPRETFPNPDGALAQSDSPFNNSNNSMSSQEPSMSNSKPQDQTSGHFDIANPEGTSVNIPENQSDNGESTSIKVEHISESDLELEITGVEPGQSGSSQDNWEPNSQIMDQSGCANLIENRTEDFWRRLNQFDIQPLNVASTKDSGTPTQEKSSSLKCPQCGRVFTSKANLNRHIANHSGVKNLQCTYCPYKTNRTDHLKLHLWTKHYSQVSNE